MNIWLIVLNADAKFRRYINNYGIEPLDSEVQAVVQETLAVVDLIYTQLDLWYAREDQQEGPLPVKDMNLSWCAENGIDCWTADLATRPDRPSSKLVSCSLKYLILTVQCENYLTNCLTKR